MKLGQKFTKMFLSHKTDSKRRSFAEGEQRTYLLLFDLQRNNVLLENVGFKINQGTDESVPFSCPRLENQNSDS